LRHKLFDFLGVIISFEIVS
jgi:hypothetical protein